MRLKNSPWSWIPSLYFAEGLPYVIVMSVSVVMYKRLGVSNADIALYTSWLYLPWVIKPFWSPVLDALRTKRWWILLMQCLMGGSFAGIAFLLPLPHAFQTSLAVFALLAFSSATHDIAADGFYMLALDEHDRSFFVGIRSTFYRLATLAGQGLLIILAGQLERLTDNVAYAWSLVFYFVAGLFILLWLYHRFVLPQPVADDTRGEDLRRLPAMFWETFVSFFRKKGIGLAIAFMMLYRLGEALLVKMASPFLLDKVEVGGLGLDTAQVGFVYGTVGVVALTLGGILGGVVVAHGGLKRWLWPMLLSLCLPNLCYVYLAYAPEVSYAVVNVCVAIEQFGYGFGFTAYMLYLMHVAEGPNKTAHYALCTGFMALGMMLPGMVAGWLQEWLGYELFFVCVMVCCLPIFLLLPFVRRSL